MYEPLLPDEDAYARARLAEVARRECRILAMLKARPHSSRELVAALGCGGSTVRNTLAALRDAGVVVTKSRAGRGCAWRLA